ncbi:hypothetical protein CS544_01525 [Porphyromonas gingivalis]|nr:hypothetical protein CS544_01525 [Porphyromonas gingivalis]
MYPTKSAKRRDTSHGFGRGNAIVRWGICISAMKCRISTGQSANRHCNCFLQVGETLFGDEMQIFHRTALFPLGHRPKTQAIVLKKKYICLRLSHSAFRIIRVKKNFLHNT